MSASDRPAMRVHLAALAHASVQQLRDAIRRVTAAHLPPEETLDEEAFLAGVEVSDSSWTDWEETSFDVRRFHG